MTNNQPQITSNQATSHHATSPNATGNQATSHQATSNQATSHQPTTIGVISDTHGYLDPRLARAFDGVDAIVHAGDVGSARVLEELRAMAPLHAVYGNNDEKLGGLGLRLHEDFEIAGLSFHLVHQLPHARPHDGTHVVVFGHSHRPLIERRGALLYVNPGGAGRAGFHRLQTVALLRVERGDVHAEIVELGPREALRRTRKAG